jgi:hypothetical protein
MAPPPPHCFGAGTKNAFELGKVYGWKMRDEILLRPKWLAAWPGQYTLIEPSIGSTAGAPDAFLVSCDFPPGWVEFKALDEFGMFHLRPAQRSWAREFLSYSSRVALCVMDKTGWHLLSMRRIVAAPFQRNYHLAKFSAEDRMLRWERTASVNLPSLLERVYAEE